MLNRLFLRFIWMVTVAFLFSGCAHLFRAPEDQPRARMILDKLENANAGLNRFKGLGQVRLEDGGQVVSGRIAMAAVMPDKLRVEWLNMMGQPLSSLSGDGENITLFMRSEQKVYHIRQSGTALEKVIHIPIGIEALQRIIAGIVPLPADTRAQIMDSPGRAEVVVLKDRWHHVVARLNVDPDTSRIISMRRYDGKGALLYEIGWMQWHAAGAFVLPRKLVFESAERQKLTLTLDRIWPNVDIPLSTFTLDLPRDSS